MKLTRVLGRLAILVVGVIVLAMAAALVIYPLEYVYRVLVWQESDAFDWQKFPAHPLDPAGRKDEPGLYITFNFKPPDNGFQLV